MIVLAIFWVVYIFWLEERLRGSIREAREQRIRVRLLGEGEPAAETGLQRWNLHLVPKRVRAALICPVAALAVYLVLEGLFRLLTG